MQLALQLYSMRDCADQIALLKALPALKITAVEGYSGVYTDAAAYRDAMDANGIIMPSGHMNVEDIETDFEATIKLVKTLGITHVFAPYLDENARPDNSEDWVTFGQRLDAAGKKYAEHGISFGWHNHDFEFVNLADGGTPMDILLDAAPDIRWEADIAWIVRGGCDPLEYIKRYGERLSAIHVKDIAPSGTNIDEDGWCDLGKGTMDWTALLQACRNASSNLIYALEHDKPSDPIGYARHSAIAFNALWEKTNG